MASFILTCFLLITCNTVKASDTPDTMVDSSCPARERKLSPRIIGGSIVEDKLEYPFMVAIFQKHRARTIGHICGGSVVNDKYVLTAAHCVTSSDGKARNPMHYYVTSGDHDICEHDPVHECISTVEHIYIHPLYKGRPWFHDISLLKTKKSLMCNDYISPACMPTSYYYTNRNAMAIGWGVTDLKNKNAIHLRSTLRHMEKRIMPFYECQEHYPYSKFMESATQTCAVSLQITDSYRGSHDGDSGSPLIQVNPNNKTIVVGVVSTSPEYAGAPVFFTDVFMYTDWIEDIVGDYC